jgi:hypothetical protein
VFHIDRNPFSMQSSQFVFGESDRIGTLLGSVLNGADFCWNSRTFVVISGRTLAVLSESTPSQIRQFELQNHAHAVLFVGGSSGSLAAVADTSSFLSFFRLTPEQIVPIMSIPILRDEHVGFIATSETKTDAICGSLSGSLVLISNLQDGLECVLDPSISASVSLNKTLDALCIRPDASGAAALHPDCVTVVSVSPDRTLHVQAVISLQPMLATLAAVPAYPASIALCPDGTLLFARSSVFLSAARSATPTEEYQVSHQFSLAAPILHVRASTTVPGGVFVTRDRIFELGGAVTVWTPIADPVGAWLCPDGTSVALLSTQTEQPAAVVSLLRGSDRTTRFALCAQLGESLAASSDGRWIAFVRTVRGTMDACVVQLDGGRIVHTTTRSLLSVRKAPLCTQMRLCFSADCEYLCVGSDRLHTFSLADFSAVACGTPIVGPFRSLRALSQSSIAAFCSGVPGGVLIVDAATLQITQQYHRPGNRVDDLDMTPDATSMIVADNLVVRHLPVSSFPIASVSAKLPKKATLVRFTAGGQTALVAMLVGLYELSLRTGKLQLLSRDGVIDLALLGDGRRVAVLFRSPAVRLAILDLASGREEASLCSPVLASATSVCALPTGGGVLTGGQSVIRWVPVHPRSVLAAYWAIVHVGARARDGSRVALPSEVFHLVARHAFEGVTVLAAFQSLDAARSAVLKPTPSSCGCVLL